MVTVSDCVGIAINALVLVLITVVIVIGQLVIFPLSAPWRCQRLTIGAEG